MKLLWDEWRYRICYCHMRDYVVGRSGRRGGVMSCEDGGEEWNESSGGILVVLVPPSRPAVHRPLTTIKQTSGMGEKHTRVRKHT